MLSSGFLALVSQTATPPVIPDQVNSDLVHLPGLQSVVADALSNPFSIAFTLTGNLVQVLGLNHFRDILPGSAPSCQFHPVSAVQPLSSASSIDFSVLSSLQLSCPEATALLSNPFLRVVSVPYVESSVLCDLSTGSL